MHRKTFKENFFVLGLLVFILGVCFHDIFFLGKTFKVGTCNAQSMHYGIYGQEKNKPGFIPVNGTDTPVLEEPLYEFIKQNLKKGILPLWNPHQACGYPLIGIIQVGLFFPLNFILFIFPQLYAWDILIMARFILAGLFTFWFMRQMGFKKIPSLSAAIIFMLSGPMVLFQYWTVNVDILTPLLFIFIDRIIRKTRLKDIACLAGIIGLTFFAGHPEHIFLVNLYGVLFLGYRFFSLRRTVNCRKVFFYALFAYALGICLSSMVLFPFLRNVLTEFWKGHPPGIGLLHEENRKRILTIALPYFFQKENLTYQFVFSGWWGGYIGIIPLGLAFLGLFNNHKKGLNYFFATVAFLFISKAYGLFYINWIGYLPIFNLCRYSPHILHLFALSLAILAGMGVRAILDNKHHFKKALLFSAPLLLIIGYHLFIYRFYAHFKISLQASLLALGILTAFQLLLFIRKKEWFSKKIFSALLIFVIALELFLYIQHERPKRYDSFPKVPYIEYLRNLPERGRSYGIFWEFYPNTATGYAVDDFGIFLDLLPKRFVHFIHNLVNRNIFKNDLRPPALRAIPMSYGTPFMDLLNVQHLVAPHDDMMAKIIVNYERHNENRTQPVYSNEVNVYKRDTAFPRVFVTHRVVFSTDKEKTFDILRSMQLHLRDFVVIDHKLDPSIMAILQATPVRDNSSAKITKYTPNEVVIEADIETPGFLILSDTYHPDWKVWINGKPSRIYIADYLIRSVFLNAGRHQVRFVFHPMSFYVGIFFSAISFFIIVVLLNWESFLRKARIIKASKKI
ncbi:MAG: YfhO family protein [Candidatus Omnitrophota bacterium]